MRTCNMDKLENTLAYLKWWEEKNKDKDAEIEYPIDFEQEMVESIKQGDILEVEDD